MHRLTSLLGLAIIAVLPLLALAQEKSTPASANGSGSNTVAAEAASNSSQDALDGAPKSCANRSLLVNFEDDRYREVREVPIWRSQDGSAFFFSARMTIDADGSPNAYSPDNMGLDDLANAGSPGHWDGIITDESGAPLIQGDTDPFPGYYVSCTALSDRSKSRFDPARYVDASKIPYIVLPGGLAREAGARLGDFAVVLNERSREFAYAIFADVGTLGEGSIALADNLGIWSNARQGGRSRGVFYVVFPGTGDGQPRSIDEINEMAAKAFKDWGGNEHLNSCAMDQSAAAPPVTAKSGDAGQTPTP